MSSYVATLQDPPIPKLKKNSKAYHKVVDDTNSMKYALRCLSIFLAEAAPCGGGVRLATLHILGKILLNPSPSLRPEALESLIANRELLSPELALTGLRLLLRKAARSAPSNHECQRRELYVKECSTEKAKKMAFLVSSDSH